MAFSGTNPFLPASVNPNLPTSSNTNPYLPASTNLFNPGSKYKSLGNIPGSLFPSGAGLSPTNLYTPVSEREYSDGSPQRNSSDETGLKPFRQTHLGRLPPEIREMIYTELLATPPAFAGHSFVATSSNVRTSSPTPIRYVHIKASWRQVIQTCRQIYYEAYPIFFASKAYFFAKPQDTENFLQYSPMTSFKLILRLDAITALCLSGFVETLPLYSNEELDEIFSDPDDFRAIHNTRQGLEMQTYKTILPHRIYCLQGLKTLKTISLCFLVGEEMLYINLLYGLTGLIRGFVHFFDTSHARWLIREQNPDDVWSIQYACFTCGAFGRGKNNEEIPDDRLEIEEEVTDIDSRAPGLQEGDERFVEVSIRWPITKSPAQGLFSSDQGDSASAHTYDDSDVVSLNRDSHETQIGGTQPADASDENDVEPTSRDSQDIQREVFPDQAGENILTEISEHDDISAEVEPHSNVNDGSPILGPDSEDIRDSQETPATHQEIDHGLLQPSSEEVSGIQSRGKRNHPAESLSLSRTLEGLTRVESMTIRDDELSLLNTGDGHDQIQDEADTNDGTAHAESSQQVENSHPEHSAETDHLQQNLTNSVGEPSLHINGTVQSSSRIRPLPDISDAPNPYTEEEMESYERWRQDSASRARKYNPQALHKRKEPSTPHENKSERPVQTSHIGTATKIPAEKRSKTASEEMLRLPVIASFLLLLVLAILEYLP